MALRDVFWNHVRLLGRLADRYHPTPARRSTVRAAQPFPRKLNFGCGYDKRDGYLNVDLMDDVAPDITLVPGDDVLPSQYFEHILAKDVLEHVQRVETMALLLDWADWLTPQGRLELETSDVTGVAQMMLDRPTFEWQHGMATCLFGNQVHEGDFHYNGFTELTLRVHLLAAGFKPVRIERVEGWLLQAEAIKTEDWTRHLAAPDPVVSAFQEGLGRDPEPHNLIYAMSQPARVAVRSVYASAERLQFTARRHGL